MSQEEIIKKIDQHIGVIPDFPKKGIIFRDIWPLLQHPDVYSDCLSLMADEIQQTNDKIDVIVGLESRGFVFGPMIAQKLNVPFVPIRKVGKLPGECVRQEYSLEYGQDSFEIQKDSIKEGQRIVIVDDLLATGGTMKAACDLIKSVKGEVKLCLVLIELVDLHGREKVPMQLKSFITYKGE